MRRSEEAAFCRHWVGGGENGAASVEGREKWGAGRVRPTAGSDGGGALDSATGHISPRKVHLTTQCN